MRRGDWKQLRHQAERLLQHHHERDMPSKSWQFGALHPDGTTDWNLAYNVTWSPGTIALSGDIGELTVTHYAALTMLRAAAWMHGSDFGYIMGKSNATEEFDPERTYDTIIEAISDSSLEAMRHIRDQRRQYRQDCKEAELGDEPDPGGYDLELEYKGPSPRHWPCIAGRYRRPPEGFDGWHRLADRLNSLWVDDDMTVSTNRRQIKEELRHFLAEASQQDAGELCQALDLSDYYGSSDYPDHRMIQYVALQRWAAHVLEEERRKVDFINANMATVHHG